MAGRGWYRAALLDTLAARELLPLLAAGQLGSSFRFRTVRERVDQYPKRSTYNPSGLPEKTVLEVQLIEVGPTPFGVYAGATAAASPAPPRSTPPRATTYLPLSPMGRDEFLRTLREPPTDTPRKAAARRAWIDKVLGPAV